MLWRKRRWWVCVNTIATTGIFLVTNIEHSHSVMHLTHIAFNHPLKSYEVSTIIMLTWQMEKLKHKEWKRSPSFSPMGSGKPGAWSQGLWLPSMCSWIVLRWTSFTWNTRQAVHLGAPMGTAFRPLFTYRTLCLCVYQCRLVTCETLVPHVRQGTNFLAQLHLWLVLGY